MDSIALIVLFEEPFWIGVLERRTGSSLQAARIVFGAEPTDAEVYDTLLSGRAALSFSSAVQVPVKATATNPKRRQREAARQTASRGISTKAQQALAAQREAWAEQRKTARRERRDEEAERKFRIRQQKRREKHRGH